MYDRITCTCGKSLAEYMPLYRDIYNAKKKIIGTDQLLNVVNGSIVTTSMCVGDILDQLYIYDICCRTKIITNIKFIDTIGMPSTVLHIQQ